MENFFTVAEVAEILKVSEVMIYKMVGEGKIPFFRIAGKTLRFRGSEIEAWLDRGRGKKYFRDKFREAGDPGPGRPSEN